MKKLITTLCAVIFTFAVFAEETSPVSPIQEVKNEAVDFENLPKESVVGALANCVKEENSLLDDLTKRVHLNRLLYPYSEGLAFVNGILCHQGHYPRSIVYTVLEGPQYGLQTVLNHYGEVLYVNYEYWLEYTPYGVILHHDYSDSEIITGSTQVISFY